MLNLNSMLLSSEAPKKLVDFYSKVLGRKPKSEVEGYSEFESGAFTLIIGPHSQVHGKSRSPKRIIINFETSDVKGEFKRIKRLGAKVITEPYQMGDAQGFLIATLADPDGNYFQLISPMKK
jgi:predicted enzyme related to lactoylglutathione lyase